MVRSTSATPANFPRSNSSKTRSQRKEINRQAAIQREINAVSASLALVCNDPNLIIQTGGDHAYLNKRFLSRLERCNRSARCRKKMIKQEHN